jgi:hypothetical protein
MTLSKLLTITACLAVAFAQPALARSSKHPHRGSDAIYLHNYGPGVWPGQPFAYYDGPLSARCKQSAAAYRGQDGRRHPCF